MPTNLRPREKAFGPGRAVPLDRNAKARIMVYARAWGARRKQPGQHKGPITRAFLEVLEALLWGFHNSRDGRCFPSYETIAAKAGCTRSTVYEALKVLEEAKVLTWQNRIIRIRESARDLFGRLQHRWRVIRTSNAYRFLDPGTRTDGRPEGWQSSKSENRAGTRIQEIQSLASKSAASAASQASPAEVREAKAALARRGAAIEARLLGKGRGREAIGPI